MGISWASHGHHFGSQDWWSRMVVEVGGQGKESKLIVEVTKIVVIASPSASDVSIFGMFK